MKIIAGIWFVIFLGLGAVGQAPAAEDAEPASDPGMLVEIESPLGFDETLERIESNARELGWKVPAKWKVDFRNNMERITETDIGPNQVLKMCEPFAAAKLLAQDRYKKLAAMMPCTIAVYVKSDGKTYVSMMNLDMMGRLYGGDVADMARELGPQMEAMITLD